MRAFLFSLLIFTAAGLSASPLEGGYALAPKYGASENEKAEAYVNARLAVINASKKYLGVPYVYGGMAASGVDCSGFICLGFKDALGVALPRSASGLYTWTVRTTIEKAQPGDMLFFRTGNSNSITHVGLYLGDRRFIHSASAGSNTGVIYSSLDEPYWSRAYAGAGRAFPEAPAGSFDDRSPAAGGQVNVNKPVMAQQESGEGRLLAGAAIAPIWNGLIQSDELVRGVSAQFYLYADTYSFGPRMVFGFEVRPEYDGALGIFNIPITLSWGPNEKIRLFAGPVISFGDASFEFKGDRRDYSKGTSWLGMIGITAAPYELSTSTGVYAPYIEAAWQSYMNFDKINPAADFLAGLRVSTGIKWLLQLK